MKYFLTLFLLVAFWISLPAQFSYGSIKLIATKKLKHVLKVPFNQVVVFDNRFDSTHFLVDRNALLPPEKDSFSMPASKEIKNYIERIIAPFPKDNRLVYISLKQLRFGNLNNFSHLLFFTADIFTPRNQKLIKIFSLQKTYFFRHSYEATITRALNDFVKKTCRKYSLDDNSRKTYAVEELNKNVSTEWASLPIVAQNNYVDGIFRTWSEFRDNKIDSCTQFGLELERDSTYRINLLQNHNYQKWNGQVENIFAVAYSGSLYIPILGKYFVPLEKMNNTFYFYVPHSLPSMFTIIPNWNLFEDVGSSVQPDFSGMDARAFLVFVGVIVVVAITVAIVRSIEKNKLRKKEAELVSEGYPGENFRNCFFDMGTGDVIYH
ncbi:MAG TPA: hypothetical protein VKR53_08485 [Puia sp.]|nr:hypothetical protein [Puia sp.]